MGCLSGYIHRLAYRHADGEVEGFVGEGTTKDKAYRDAIRQVCRKLGIPAPGAVGFDPTRVINDPLGLPKTEITKLRKAWVGGARY